MDPRERFILERLHKMDNVCPFSGDTMVGVSPAHLRVCRTCIRRARIIQARAKGWRPTTHHRAMEKLPEMAAQFLDGETHSHEGAHQTFYATLAMSEDHQAYTLEYTFAIAITAVLRSYELLRLTNNIPGPESHGSHRPDFPDNEVSGGVREPRRPYPSAGGGVAFAISREEMTELMLVGRRS